MSEEKEILMWISTVEPAGENINFITPIDLKEVKGVVLNEYFTIPLDPKELENPAPGAPPNSFWSWWYNK